MKVIKRAGRFVPFVVILLAYLLTACVAPAQTVATQQSATQQSASQQTASTQSGSQQAQVVPVTEKNLVGPTWHWFVWLKGTSSAAWPVPAPEKYTISFLSNGMVSVQADCNRVAGTYIARGGTLLIELGPSTMAYCGAESLDSEFLALINQVVGGALINDQLSLSLNANAGSLGFQPGNQSASAGLAIKPQDIHLDTQGLPYSWQANVVAATPYDASQAPGPQGLPEHIEINFGVTNPADKKPGDPVMYIIPVDAYRDLWTQAGNNGVSQMIDQIFKLTVALPNPPPVNGLPALPYEEVAGVNDLATQVGRATVTDLSASKSGFRFVGRWMQSPNPVINGDLRYVYQGFTNDGRYLVSFFYPVTTPALPNSASAVSAQEMQALQSNASAYLQSKAQMLNGLPPSGWAPDLGTLDALVGSLQIDEMATNGLVGNEWRPVATTSAPGGAETPISQPEKYKVVYYSDGKLDYVADCNAATGTYTLSGGMVGSIRTTLSSTKLPDCGPDSYADELVGTLMSAQDFRVLPGGERMELVRPAGGGSLIFELIGPTTPVPATPVPATPTAAATLVPTATPVQPIVMPTPAPQTPTGRVIAPDGVNVRSGPSTQYPVIGFAPFGTTGQIVGRSADGQWWTFAAPRSPTGLAWVSATYIQATNAQNVPVLPAPPLPVAPTPVPTAVPPTPVPPPMATPAPFIQFGANPTTIVEGQCTTLSWNVQNVAAVWVYPLGADYGKYPVAGVGSRQECPTSTTTYEMRVALSNGAVEYRQVTVGVEANDPLRSTEWRLVSLRNAALVPNSTITLNFGDVNDINGNSGCNSYSGSYSVNGSTLQIRGVISTGALCGAEIDQQEQSYLSTLPSAGSYDLQGGQLVIRDLSGAEILRYNPAD